VPPRGRFFVYDASFNAACSAFASLLFPAASFIRIKQRSMDRVYVMNSSGWISGLGPFDVICLSSGIVTKRSATE